ncbi:hypothetical protein HJG60_009601 [Phyllostomus discolor]|uniref:Uncharacterized protein n=1 Tax=Phyllostomus discolor TaxID=89673 RepID=A0A834DC40_9CHIR|nr:hypothetical protein HJG60_009601 [Phyllostomus discolor]
MWSWAGCPAVGRRPQLLSARSPAQGSSHTARRSAPLRIAHGSEKEREALRAEQQPSRPRLRRDVSELCQREISRSSPHSRGGGAPKAKAVRQRSLGPPQRLPRTPGQTDEAQTTLLACFGDEATGS